ncbi:MAG TPA: mechanosensitive ion channel domain-containing protein [Gaiellaceae bacterium]|nr:mechanosensitive ion channel domain-containing protein [Gaiellaceae bacterium]
MVLALTAPAWTGIVVGGGVLFVAVVELLLVRTIDDRATRFGIRRSVRFGTGLVVLVALAGIWHVFGGHIGLVVGLGAAGLGFALQNVIGAVFGWMGILVSGIFRIGDRISFAGVEGDVIDLTPLRTVILEMGSPLEFGVEVPATTWVRGRQYTGRTVAIPNYRVLTDPVYNYSGVFEYIWEELTLPISYRSDWREAERILLEEVRQASASEGAQEAMKAMERRYPVPHTEVEPAVYVRATDNWWEISGRFVVPIRTVRTTKSDLTKRVRQRFDEAGIELASSTSEQAVRFPDGLPTPDTAHRPAR